MHAMADLRAALKHVYWLGGGSGAGKSTIARRLVAAHDMTLYSTDEVMGDHGKRCAPDECPRMENFKQMTMDERWINRTPDVMLDTFHWFHGEGFHFILEDLLALPRGRKVIVEGFRLLPHLVTPVLASSHQAIWLIPTPEFRVKAIEARGTMWDIPKKTSQPEKALQNLLTRDAMFTEQLKNQADAEGVAMIVVDSSRSEDELLDAVGSHFVLPANTGRGS